MITKTWIDEQGEGHWEVSCGDITVSCDDNELSEVLKELAA